MATYKGLVFEWKQYENSFEEYVLVHLEKEWNMLKSNSGSINSNEFTGLNHILLRWWDDVKNNELPFSAFRAEQIIDDKYKIKLVKKREDNSIARLFYDANISLENAPPVLRWKLPEWIQSKKDTTLFKIGGIPYQIIKPLVVDKENSNSWLYEAKDTYSGSKRVIKILHSREDKEGQVYNGMPYHSNIVLCFGVQILFLYTWIALEDIEGERVTRQSFVRYPELIDQLASVKQFLASNKINWEKAESNTMYIKPNSFQKKASLKVFDFGTTF